MSKIYFLSVYYTGKIKFPIFELTDYPRSQLYQSNPEITKHSLTSKQRNLSQSQNQYFLAVFEQNPNHFSAFLHNTDHQTTSWAKHTSLISSQAKCTHQPSFEQYPDHQIPNENNLQTSKQKLILSTNKLTCEYWHA